MTYQPHHHHHLSMFNTLPHFLYHCSSSSKATKEEQEELKEHSCTGERDAEHSLESTGPGSGMCTNPGSSWVCVVMMEFTGPGTSV